MKDISLKQAFEVKYLINNGLKFNFFSNSNSVVNVWYIHTHKELTGKKGAECYF